MPLPTVIASTDASPSNLVPPATALDGAVGTINAYALADHTHAARIQRTVMTTDANGNITWTFARPFISNPAVMALANSSSQIIISITTKSTTSVTINCRMAQKLPAVLALLTALINFDIFASAAASVQIDLFAGETTQ